MFVTNLEQQVLSMVLGDVLLVSGPVICKELGCCQIMENEWLVVDANQKPIYRETHQEPCESLVALSKYLCQIIYALRKEHMAAFRQNT